MHLTMLGFTPNMISCISVTTYFYVYLAGDQTWIMPLGEVCSRELPYMAITSSAQTTRRASSDLADPQPRGLAKPTMCCFPLTRSVPTLLSVPSVARLAPMLGGWARQGTRRTFGGSSSSRARGLGTTGHSACFPRLV
jgi:hypothetical protein